MVTGVPATTYLLADGRGTGVEDSPPVAMSEYRHRSCAAPVVFRCELAANDRPDTQHLEEIVSREPDVGTFRHVADPREQRVWCSPLSHRLLEYDALLDLLDFCVNEAGSNDHLAAAQAARADDEQFLGIGNRQRIDQHRRECGPRDRSRRDRAPEGGG